MGCNGLAAIPAMLGYVDYSAIWVLPIAHILLFGVVAGLWKFFLLHVPRGQPRPPYALSNPTRRLIQARSQEIDVTADFGRPCR